MADLNFDPLPEEESPGVPVAPDQPVATGQLSPQDLYKLGFNRQLQDPSIYGGGLGGRRLLQAPPPGTGVTWATREDGTQTPVTYITGPSRSPIQPPSGGGVPVPDMNPFVTQAFQHLPVDQAAKAIEVATRYQGQRGYQRDLQSGMSAPQAFAKWAPMLFHSNATGMTEALKLSQPTPEPKQGPLGVTFGGRFYPNKAQAGAVSPLGKLQQDRAAAVARGDTLAVQQYDAAIQEALTNKGFAVSMGFDDQGKEIMNVVSGGAKPISTVATASLAQQKNLQYENATELLTWLQNHLKPEHVGALGKGGEFVVDRTLEQLLPGVANKERIDVRSALDMAQGLAREIVDDRSSRFSAAERDAVLGALPSTGVFESYADAQGRIKRAKEVLANRGKVYSRQLNQKTPPLYTLSAAEIKAAYKAKEITKEQAAEALKRFHGFTE